MSLDDDIVRGDKAAEVLRNDVFRDSFETLEGYYIEQWKQSDVSDVEGRERLYIAIGVLRHIFTQLESLMMSGKMATEQLGAEKKPPLH